MQVLIALLLVCVVTGDKRDAAHRLRQRPLNARCTPLSSSAKKENEEAIIGGVVATAVVPHVAPDEKSAMFTTVAATAGDDSTGLGTRGGGQMKPSFKWAILHNCKSYDSAVWLH